MVPLREKNWNFALEFMNMDEFIIFVQATGKLRSFIFSVLSARGRRFGKMEYSDKKEWKMPILLASHAP